MNPDDRGVLIPPNGGRESRSKRRYRPGVVECHRTTGGGARGAREGLGACREGETLQRQLGSLEGRLELTEVTESTLRESLERERERADHERERAERLEQELQEARRSWWRRLFGG
jgi:chromosome segregation ATPase